MKWIGAALIVIPVIIFIGIWVREDGWRKVLSDIGIAVAGIVTGLIVLAGIVLVVFG